MKLVENKLFSLDAAAQLLGGISVWTLRKAIQHGHVQVVRMGRRVMLSPDEVDRIAREGLPSLTSVVPARPSEEALVGSRAGD